MTVINARKQYVARLKGGSRKRLGASGCVAAALLIAGCQTPGERRDETDEEAYETIAQKQEQGLGETEAFTIEQPARTLRDRLLLDQNLPFADEASFGSDALEPIDHWPDDDYLSAQRPGRPPSPNFPDTQLLTLNLNEALQVAARNSRDYQTQKETVFRAALDLDLEEETFRNQFAGLLEGLASADLDGADTNGGVFSAEGGLARRFKSGAALTSQIAFDLAQLLTQGGGSSLGLLVDGSIEIPLLRGAGRWVVAEPLTQAERNALYAIYDFERFKRVFAVDIASDFLGVLQQRDQVDNAEENYRSLITSTRRIRALADEGRVTEIQVDQARQDELLARNRWISATTDFEEALDRFKVQLGLPTDAAVQLDRDTLGRLASAVREGLPTPPSADEAEGPVPAADAPVALEVPDRDEGGRLEIDPFDAIVLALENRLDLRVAEGEVYDAMRDITVAANAFLPEFTIFASASTGSRRTVGTAQRDDASVGFNRGSYDALLRLDLPIERTEEEIVYRNQFIDLERSIRDLQELEDTIKLSIRNQLRDLLEARESLRIQEQAVALAQRRVDSTQLLLELGRAEVRDVLEAQDALLAAQNALTAALVNYRISELELQRDLGLLEVDETGLWEEYVPPAKEDNQS